MKKLILLILLLFIIPLFAQNYSINPDSSFRATLATTYDGGAPCDFTIEFWAKRASNTRCFFMQYGGINPIMFYPGDGIGTNGFRYQGYSGGGTLGAASIYGDSCAADLNQWTHVVMAADVDLVKIYIYQGNETNADTLASENNYTTRPAITHLFARLNNSEPFSGLVDEIRIWSTTRTLAEINANKLKELTGSETGLLYYWKFNNDLTSSATVNTLTESWGTAQYSTDVPFVLDTTKYYIDADKGNDANGGQDIVDALASFDSINTAGITLEAGDKVYLRTDDTFDPLDLSASGSAASAITITSYDSTGESGAKPIIRID